MNNISLRSMNNSRAVYEPFINVYGTDYVTGSFTSSHYAVGMQSSSVTPKGLLWQQRLLRMAHDNPATASKDNLGKTELDQRVEQTQKNHAVIQLLKSWREGDEQEQRSTWEYLKQALDEDRLSERKLFP